MVYIGFISNGVTDMKHSFTTNSAAANKMSAIKIHQNAIKSAREFLAIEGNEPAYYDWHNRSIASNKARIEAILSDADTSWN